MTAPNVNEDTTTTAPAAPAVEAPATPVVEQDYSRSSIDARTEASATEHFTQRALETVAAKGDKITVADLRSLPGAAGKTDAELEAMWKSVQPAAAVPAVPPAGATAAQKRAWKAYNGDTEVADFSKMSAEDFLKLQYGYNANGKEHRKTLDEVFRNASNGHYNQERTQQLQQERNTALEKWRQFEQQATEGARERQAWDGALNAAANGNYEPIQNMLNAYVQALGVQPQQPNAPAMIPAAQVEAERAGTHVYNTVVLPKAAELAQKFSVPAGEVAEAIMAMVNAEAPEFLTPARFQQIVDVELPQAIESFIAQRPAPAAPAAPAADPAIMEELVRLRDENGRFKAGAAVKHNTAVEELHARRAAAPPAAPAVSGTGGTNVPNFEGASGAREWLRNFKG